ncbi:carotenoid oxygenase family protein [Haladaptatus sp. DJG-WS-42]|uniref:carotenoid oxygenase family protein n=1 Tax=Haladaptatus sp. DJG-WS-42 TaxID=3120516 RepID=UPI0030CBDB60
MNGYGRGFSTLTEERTAESLLIVGAIPDWLRGTLIRNGPGHFELGEGRVTHWFDGLAMLRKFSFADGDVTYSNHFLRTETYKARKQGNLGPGEFATAPATGFLAKLKSIVVPETTDNANVTIGRVGGHMVALTEVPRVVAFNPATLETHGEVSFDDDLTGHVMTAHVHHDDERNETVGLLTKFGKPSTYTIYRLPDGSLRREEVASLKVSRPAYIHSIGLTDRYVILVEAPFTVNPLSFLKLGNDGFIEHFTWDGTADTRFIIVDRERGRAVATPQTAAFFAFHHVNAFERDDSIVLDLVAYPNPDIIDGLYLDRLERGEFKGLVGELRRYTLPTDDTGQVECEPLSEIAMELPTISPTVRRQPHRYVYGQGSVIEGDGFSNYLVKADVASGSAAIWTAQETFCGEPIFVPRPDATAEDDGVVLSVILDTAGEQSFLLVLDGETFVELARAPLPHVLPFDFHGEFFDCVW